MKLRESRTGTNPALDKAVLDLQPIYKLILTMKSFFS